jgi:hypothetical protein
MIVNGTRWPPRKSSVAIRASARALRSSSLDVLDDSCIEARVASDFADPRTEHILHSSRINLPQVVNAAHSLSRGPCSGEELYCSHSAQPYR